MLCREMKKALPFSKELSICCLWQEQYPGGSRLMRPDAWPLSALTPQPWAQWGRGVSAVGCTARGTGRLGQPGTLFPRPVLVSVVEVW